MSIEFEQDLAHAHELLEEGRHQLLAIVDDALRLRTIPLRVRALPPYPGRAL